MKMNGKMNDKMDGEMVDDMMVCYDENEKMKNGTSNLPPRSLSTMFLSYFHALGFFCFPPCSVLERYRCNLQNFFCTAS